MPRKSTKAGWDEFKVAKESMPAIVDYVEGGESLASFCRERGFNYVTVLNWINADAGRTENYAHAREAREEFYFDKVDLISEQAVAAETNVTVNGLRLASDNLKWKLARMSPKKFGDKIAIGGADDLPPIRTMTDEQLDAKLAALRARINQG